MANKRKTRRPLLPPTVPVYRKWQITPTGPPAEVTFHWNPANLKTKVKLDIEFEALTFSPGHLVEAFTRRVDQFFSSTLLLAEHSRLAVQRNPDFLNLPHIPAKQNGPVILRPQPNPQPQSPLLPDPKPVQPAASEPQPPKPKRAALEAKDSAASSLVFLSQPPLETSPEDEAILLTLSEEEKMLLEGPAAEDQDVDLLLEAAVPPPEGVGSTGDEAEPTEQPPRTSAGGSSAPAPATLPSSSAAAAPPARASAPTAATAATRAPTESFPPATPATSTSATGTTSTETAQTGGPRPLMDLLAPGPSQGQPNRQQQQPSQQPSCRPRPAEPPTDLRQRIEARQQAAMQPLVPANGTGHLPPLRRGPELYCSPLPAYSQQHGHDSPPPPFHRSEALPPSFAALHEQQRSIDMAIAEIVDVLERRNFFVSRRQVTNRLSTLLEDARYEPYQYGRYPYQ